MKNDSNLPANISADELLKVQESLNVVTGQKSKRVTYSEDDKQEVTKYALLCGASAAVRHFRKKYPHLTESTVRPWVKRYQKSIKEQKKLNPTAQAATPKIGKPRGRPLYLEEELDTKVRSMLVSLRVAGGGINIHVVRGVLNGLIRENPVKYGKYLEFKVTRSWTRSLYQRMNYTRRAVTTQGLLLQDRFGTRLDQDIFLKSLILPSNTISLMS